MVKKKESFESQLAQLQALVKKLEQGELSLDESLAAFEQGVKLTRACQKILAEAEQKVKVLNSDGELSDFNGSE